MASPAEIWKLVTGWEEFYEISDSGRVRSFDRLVPNRHGSFSMRRGRILKPRHDPDGYPNVILCRHGERYTIKIHSLVANHFLISDNIFEVNPFLEIHHKDSNKDNNHVSNLEWITHIDNVRHAGIAGRTRARTNPRRAKKLDSWTADAILKARQAGISYREISSQFCIGQTTARQIAIGKIWR